MTTADHPALDDLWMHALRGEPGALEQRLVADSHLPGPRANLELAHRVADCAQQSTTADRVAALRLVARWLAAPPGEADPPREYLAAVAALSAGGLLAARPDPDAAGLLSSAASDPRWRVRELAATGMQRVLAADWDRGIGEVRSWLRAGPLPARAAVAAVAEPALLRDAGHASVATHIVEQAADILLLLPLPERRATDPRVLRQALGYAVSVVAAADPSAGVPLLERLATSTDPDARWIARENLKKSRLAGLADRLVVARDAASRPAS